VNLPAGSFFSRFWTQFSCKGVKQINNRISLNMTFTFTIHISLRFSSALEFQMGNFQKYWSQNVGQDFIVLDFFHGRKILKVDGRDPQNRENNFLLGGDRVGGKGVCGRLMSPAQETQSMRIHVGYLSSSEAYTNNWGLFGKENYLAFDWWKHFL
jgi:hypothetical protein